MKQTNVIFLIIIQMMVLLNSSANSAETYLKIFSLSNDYSQSKVWSGVFTAPNGKTFDTSNYYRNTRNEFHVNGELFLINLKTKYTISIPFYYDNGYQSSLFNAQERFDLGLSLSGMLSDNFIYGVSTSSLLSYGGEVREYPCVDSFQREFHCGTGLPWTDAESFLIKGNSNGHIHLKIQYLF